MKYMKVALILTFVAGLFAPSAQAVRLNGLSGEYQQVAPGQYSQSRQNPGTRYGRVLYYAPVTRPVTIDLKKKGRPSGYTAPVSSRAASLKSAVAKRKKSLSRASSGNRQDITGLAARQRAALANLLAGGSSNTVTRVHVGLGRSSDESRKRNTPVRDYSNSGLSKSAKARRAARKPVTAFERKSSLKDAVDARKASLRVAKAPNRLRKTLGPPPPFRKKYTKTARDWVKRYK